MKHFNPNLQNVVYLLPRRLLDCKTFIVLNSNNNFFGVPCFLPKLSESQFQFPGRTLNISAGVIIRFSHKNIAVNPLDTDSFAVVINIK